MRRQKHENVPHSLSFYVKQFSPLIENGIKKRFGKLKLENFYDAMRYAFSTGGKRFRPVLCLTACKLLGGDVKKALPLATAIETLHNFCLTGDTKILVNPGEPKRIDEIKVNDIVYTLDLKTGNIRKRRVRGLKRSGVMEVYELRTSVRNIKATANHPFLVVEKKHPLRFKLTKKGSEKIYKLVKKKRITFRFLEKKLGLPPGSRNWWSRQPHSLIPPHLLRKVFHFLGLKLEKDDYTTHIAKSPVVYSLKWKPLSKLKKGDLIVILKKLPDDGEPQKLPSVDISKEMSERDNLKLPTKTTLKFCQLVGAFLGDGSIHMSRRYANFILCMPKTDPTRKKYVKIFKDVFKKEIKEKEDYLICSSRKLCLMFDRLGLNRKAPAKFIPPWIYKLPRKQKLALLRGFLDSDGTVNKRGTTIFASSSKKLIEGIKILLDSLGFRTSNINSRIVDNEHFKRYVKKTRSRIWSLEIRNPEKVLKEIGTENKLYRKRLMGRRSVDFDYGVGTRIKIDRRFFGFDKVKSIKSLGKKPVYDIEVEKSHNFVANGIVVHNSLIHDDIEDQDKKRRGFPTVWKKYGIPYAINIGDGMMIKTLDILLEMKNHLSERKMVELLEWFTQTSIKIIEGQAMELNFRKKRYISEKDYLEMVKRKTGALIGFSLASGAFVANAPKKLQKRLEEIGMLMGCAFQIRDDVLNLTGKEEIYGKEIGGDIKEGKRTLMVIHCISKCKKNEREKLLKILIKEREKTSRGDVEYAISLLKKYGSIEYALRFCENLVRKIKRKVNEVRCEKLRELLNEIADFVVEREF